MSVTEDVANQSANTIIITAVIALYNYDYPLIGQLISLCVTLLFLDICAVGTHNF